MQHFSLDFRQRLGMLTFCFLCCCAVTVGQQSEKLFLTKKDYPLFTEQFVRSLSGSGEWLTYILRTKNPQSDPATADSIVVMHRSSTPSYRFADNSTGSLVDNWFGQVVQGKGLQLIDLPTGRHRTVDSITSFSFLLNGKYLVMLEQKTGQPNRLLISTPQGAMMGIIDSVSFYSIHPPSGSLFYCSASPGRSTAGLIRWTPAFQHERITDNTGSAFTNPVWDRLAESVSFLQEGKDTQRIGDHRVWFYRIAEKRLYSFQLTAHPRLSSQLIIGATVLRISSDGRQVFFGLNNRQQETLNRPSTVQVWNGNDQWLYPKIQLNNSYPQARQIMVWCPATDSSRVVTSWDNTWSMLTADDRFIISANPLAYEPQYREDRDMDYFMTDVNTGENWCWSTKHSDHESTLGISPNGRYVHYFRDDDWWIYNIATRTHHNVTAGLPSNWNNKATDAVKGAWPFGSAGWSKDGQWLLVYDQHDLWALSPTGADPLRLTRGREKAISLRVYVENFATVYASNLSGRIAISIDLQKPVILTATGDLNGATGYFLWSKKRGTQPLAYSNSATSNLKKATDREIYLFSEQRFDCAPRLLIKNGLGGALSLVEAGNPQQSRFHWGRSEMIFYQNSPGQSLRGALFYPAGYDSTRKYPMIVHIYEKESRDIYQYQCPSLMNATGFNITNLTSQGYFVLLPDINYGLGATGAFATDCVLAATKAAIATGRVMPGKIGLIGHSFGGFETNFIIGQTSLFAAAVSGAGYSDLTSAYFTMGWSDGRSDAWRFESQQMRMGASFYKNPDAYRRNSPLLHAASITTPLLLWAGDNDQTVNWSQTLAFYLGLRRLQKKQVMLIYPNEFHWMTSTANDIDLTERIEAWFAYFLKDDLSADWITQGIQNPAAGVR